MIRIGILSVASLIIMSVANPAQAQYGPQLGFNYRFGATTPSSFNPFIGALPNVPNRFQTQQFSYSGVGLSGPYSLQYGTYRNTAVLPAYSAPSPYSAGYYGGLSAGYSAVNDRANPAVAKQRNAIAAAQRNAEWDRNLGGKAAEVDRVLNVAAIRKENEAPGVALPKLRPALIDPTDEAILRGDVLNELSALIHELQSKGKTATSGLCPPDLITKVVFEGDVAADAANLFRNRELMMPEKLKSDDFKAIRKELDAAYAPVSVLVCAGKKPVAKDVEQFLKMIATTRIQLDRFIQQANAEEACQLTDYLNGLEGAAKYLKEPTATGIAGVRWSATGVSVADLVKHLIVFKLRFGNANRGDEAAYYSLHRGMLAYYAGLLEAK